MENNKTSRAPQKKNGAKILLDALSIVAEKNATVLCKGFMYEPEIPEKLRKYLLKTLWDCFLVFSWTNYLLCRNVEIR